MVRVLLLALSLVSGFSACGQTGGDTMNKKPATAPLAPLLGAIRSDDASAVRQALAAGLDVNAVAEGGRPLLQWAFHDQSRGVFEALLKAGADPSRVDADGFSAVHLAAMHESTWWLQTLLAHGANPDVPNGKSGDRPIMDAVKSHRDDNINLLIRAGANLNAPGAGQLTALHVAAMTKRARYSLQFLRAGADPLAKNDNGRTFQAYQWMGREDLLSPEVRRDREAIRQWLREHRIAVQDDVRPR
jgi:uncharacterized protein